VVVSRAAPAADPRPAPAPDAWIGDLFAAPVLTGSLALDAADPGALAPAEAALAARFAPARLRAFAAGRQCARALLAALGAGVPALLVDGHRAPIWPEGIIGTIAHDAGLAVAAVARRGVLRGLGVDLEPDEPLSEPVRRRVCTPGEARALAYVDDTEAGRRAKLLFVVKEAIYKCVHPLVRAPLGLRDVEIELDFAGGRFHARALPHAPEAAAALVGAIEGRFARRGGRFLAGATLRAPAAPGAPASAGAPAE
jgi:4'-phosphopantetheinyl transferase EntD